MNIDNLLQEAKGIMQKAHQHAQSTFATFHVNRVDPKMVNHITVNYHSTPTPLYQVASIVTENATTLVVKPWEKAILTEISRSISQQDQHDFTLTQREDAVYLHRRPLTEESRRKLAKQLATKLEEARVAIRNARKHIKQEAKAITEKDAAKQLENKLQELTNDFIKKVESDYKNKEAEIMKV